MRRAPGGVSSVLEEEVVGLRFGLVFLDDDLVWAGGGGGFEGAVSGPSSLGFSSAWRAGLGMLSRTLTIMPSHLMSVADLKNSRTISESEDVASMFLTQVKRLGISTKRLRRSSLLSRKGLSRSSSPFKYMRSKEKRQTATLIDSIATSFLALFVKVWNAFRSPVSWSMATTSPSRMKLLTPSPRI